MGWKRTGVILNSLLLLAAIFTQLAVPVDVNQFLTVITTCGLATDVSVRSFGSVEPGLTSGEVSVRVNNTGSVSTTVNLTASDWWNSTNTFDAERTHFNYTDASQDYDTEMLPLLVDTNQTIGSIANGGSKLVYYKVRIALGQAHAVYRQETQYSTVC